MGEKDITEKTLEDYNDVFADIMNVLLFDGKQLVKESELSNTRTKSQLKINGTIHEQERDNVKIWQQNHIRIAMIGFENQTDVDKYEPARVLSYDGSSYKEQLVEIDSCRKKKKAVPPLVPVVTLVIHFGKDNWLNHTLYDCMSIPDCLKKYISDYKINVVNIKDLSREQVDEFKSDFHTIADYFYKISHGQEYIPDNRQMDHPDAVLKLMAALTGDNRFEETSRKISALGKENITMCEALDIIEARGEARGKAEGIQIFIEDKLEDNIPDDRIIEKLKAKYGMTESQAKSSIQECRDAMKAN